VTELLVLRHAKAAEGRDDHARPLAKRGERDAPRIGRWIAEHDLAPDRVIVSSSMRTRQTAALVLAELGAGAPEPLADERLYLATIGTLLEVVVELGRGAERLLVVGHNPGMSDLVEVLAGDEVPPDPETGVVFPTSALACLRLDGGVHEIGRGCAELVHYVRARQLAKDEAR
jgi:phosphohistidine phosphatase